MYPNLALPEQSNCQIGKYGKMHLDCLKQHRHGRYSTLLGEGRRDAYLSEIDEQAHEMLSSLIVELAKSQGIDEYLKETDQLRWVQMMNNVKTQVEKLYRKK